MDNVNFDDPLSVHYVRVILVNCTAYG